MTRRSLAVILLAAFAFVVACSVPGGGSVDSTAEIPAQMSFSLTSPTFADGESLPLELATPAAGGQNVSPGLKWSGTPAQTRSYAVECIDMAPAANEWVHWLVVNVPASEDGIAEGASGSSMPAGAVELQNTFGRMGWGGPQPPRGSHDYRFTVYALDMPNVQVASDASLDEFRTALRAHVLAKATLTGSFERR